MKNLELPEHWWRRWDNVPGTIHWWLEYYVWKFFGLCYYSSRTPRNNWLGWVKAGRGCNEALEAERSVLNPSLWGPAEIISGPDVVELLDADGNVLGRTELTSITRHEDDNWDAADAYVIIKDTSAVVSLRVLDVDRNVIYEGDNTDWIGRTMYEVAVLWPSIGFPDQRFIERPGQELGETDDEYDNPPKVAKPVYLPVEGEEGWHLP